MNARLKLSTLFTVLHSPMFHHPLFVHKWTCEIGSKKGSERAMPNTFQQPDIFGRHKKRCLKMLNPGIRPKIWSESDMKFMPDLDTGSHGMWCCWRWQVHNNFIRHGFWVVKCLWNGRYPLVRDGFGILTWADPVLCVGPQKIRTYSRCCTYLWAPRGWSCCSRRRWRPGMYRLSIASKLDRRPANKGC